MELISCSKRNQSTGASYHHRCRCVASQRIRECRPERFGRLLTQERQQGAIYIRNVDLPNLSPGSCCDHVDSIFLPSSICFTFSMDVTMRGNATCGTIARERTFSLIGSVKTMCRSRIRWILAALVRLTLSKQHKEVLQKDVCSWSGLAQSTRGRGTVCAIIWVMGPVLRRITLV